jgi:parallel beta-helix repeat protein
MKTKAVSGIMLTLFLMLTLSTVLVKSMVATYPFEDIFKKDLLDLANGTPKIESIYIKSWMDTRPSGHLWAFIRINYTAGLSDHEKISVQDYVQRQLESEGYIDIVERNYIYVYCGYPSPPVPWPGFVIGDLNVGFKSVTADSNVVVSNGFVLETDKAVYACGELVKVTFTNYSNETLELSSWPSFEIYDSQGDYVAPTILAFCCPEVSPQESHSWTWDQRTFNSTEVPAGNYTVMLRFRDTVTWTWVTLYLGFEIVGPKTWTVDHDGQADFHTIQEAINAADEGDTIFVHSGTYYENVVVNKTVSLIGENRNNTIIDANGNGTVVYVTANNVSVSGFTIQNSGYTDAGIYLDHSCRSTVSDNKIATWGVGIDLFGGSENDLIGNIIGGSYSWYGIRLWNSSDNVISRNLQGSSDVGIKLIGSSHNYISGNKLVFNMANGMALHGGSDNNFITKNTIEQSLGGLWLDKSNGNTIYQNNFNNMEIQVSLSDSTNNTWDNGYPSGGNYWSDYTLRYPTIGDEYQGENQDILGSDGIWDTPYVIDLYNQDNYPLVSPWIPVAVDTIAPMADAGPDQTVDEDTLVTFDGSASWDNVGIESYTWTFTDVTPQTLSGENPAYNFTTSGTYIVTLTVEDAAGNTASDTVTLTVLFDTDGDETPDVTDPDDDNDCTNDDEDAFPLDPTEKVDTDGDGTGNNADPDDDNDGMPDTWETENGLNSLDAADASLDPDGDGLTNLQEYQGDTDPNVSNAEAVPWWILGTAAAVVIVIAVATAFLLRRRK